jgi:hypothetical protein
MTNTIYFDWNRNPYHPHYAYEKFQHIRVTAFRESLRTYERDTKGIEEHPVQS